MERVQLLTRRVSFAPYGMSLVEVVVVIAILGVLMSLLLPAVQSSRAQARRVQCVNNLRQIGIGFHQHAEQKGYFPTARHQFLEILPYLELADLQHKFKEGSLRPPFYVPWISCPEDSLVDRSMAQPSYLISQGTQFRIQAEWNGFSKGRARDTRPSDITDGLSQTAAISERLVAPHSTDIAAMTRQTGRYFQYTQKEFAQAGQEELAVQQCKHHRTTPFPQFFQVNAGGLLSGIGFDHLLPPNHIGCFNGPEDFTLHPDHAIIPPSSLHSGGVNVLYADGSVHFVSDFIDTGVWRAMGTRSGGETVSAIE